LLEVSADPRPLGYRAPPLVLLEVERLIEGSAGCGPMREDRRFVLPEGPPIPSLSRERRSYFLVKYPLLAAGDADF
jgi:hypothetical protein